MASSVIDAVSLSLAEQDYREAESRAEELRVFRNELISRASAAGMTHAQISEATGLTRSRVGQIALQGR